MTKPTPYNKKKDEEKDDPKLKQRLAVAEFTTELAEGTDAQYKTEDPIVAMLIAMTLTKFIKCDTPKKVAEMVDLLIHTFEERRPGVQSWTYLCLNANWLAWAWDAQKEVKLSKAWSEAWYLLNDFSLKHLTGDDLRYYVKKTD